MNALFPRIAIIGLGLIGSSIARAARQRGVAKTIVGYDAIDISMAYARKQGLIDSAAPTAVEAVSASGLVILATPPSALANTAKAIAPHFAPAAIVMDVCSVKQAAIQAIAPHLPQGIAFIPAHPVAGSEQSGAHAGRGDLFERCRVIVTPEKALQTEALQAVTAFWRALGARVEAMPPAVHDLLYAHVSHLPHLLAFAAAKPLAAYRTDECLHKFMRLSNSNPKLWAEIFSLNKHNVLNALDRYLDAVSHIVGELAKAPASPSPQKLNSGGEGWGGGELRSDIDARLTPSLTLPPNGGGDSLELAHTMLFPRIAASCLISTVMQAERNAGFPFARYAGPGFADFTSPAAAPPEGDIEQVSGQYQAVADILAVYIERLKTIRAALSDTGDVEQAIIMNK